MIATIEGEVLGTKELKTSKGILYAHILQVRDKAGLPYNIDVLSKTNSVKVGTKNLRVNIGLRRKNDQIRGFSLWMVDKE